jgi:hypothetical protein
VWLQPFHYIMSGVTQHKTKIAFINEVATRQINSIVEASFRVMYQERGQSYYFRLPLERTYEDCILSRRQDLHEIFLASLRVKLFFLSRHAGGIHDGGREDILQPSVLQLSRAVLYNYNRRLSHCTGRVSGFGKSPHQTWRC